MSDRPLQQPGDPRLSFSLAGLKNRLDRMESAIANLNRRGEWPVERELELDDLTDVDTTTAAPADGNALVYDSASGLWVPGAVGGGGGCDTEAFKAQASSPTTLTSSSGEITFNWTGTGVGSFYTSGVSGIGSGGTSASVPSGLWLVAFSVQIRCLTVPTSGKIDFYIQTGSGGGARYSCVSQVWWRRFENNYATTSISEHFYLASASTIRVAYSYTLNQTPTVYDGKLSAHRFCTPAGGVTSA